MSWPVRRRRSRQLELGVRPGHGGRLCRRVGWRKTGSMRSVALGLHAVHQYRAKPYRASRPGLPIACSFQIALSKLKTVHATGETLLQGPSSSQPGKGRDDAELDQLLMVVVLLVIARCQRCRGGRLVLRQGTGGRQTLETLARGCGAGRTIPRSQRHQRKALTTRIAPFAPCPRGSCPRCGCRACAGPGPAPSGQRPRCGGRLPPGPAKRSIIAAEGSVAAG